MSELVPRLRFRHFTDDWKQERLENLCDNFKSGSTITSASIFSEGKYPVYGGNGLRGFTDTFTHNGHYILIGRQGALCGNINESVGFSFISEHAIVIGDNDLSDITWLKYKLDYMGLNRYSESSAQPGLSVGRLKRLKIFHPTKKEQQKIADFLTSVDTKISQLTEKHRLLQEYKKGVMQQIFSQQIRFKDKNGEAFLEWEEKYFHQAFERKTKKNKENNLNVLTISAQQGLVSQLDYFNKSVSAKDLTGYYLLERGDFAYNKSYSKGYPMGAIKPLKLYDKGVVSTLYICFKAKENSHPEFFEQFFNGGMLNHEIAKIAQEGARNHGLLNVSVKEFFEDIKLNVPSLAEQQKIAQYLQAIDQKIAAVAEQVEQSKQFKKGLLQQMFV